jgi:hypothetical protein
MSSIRAGRVVIIPLVTSIALAVLLLVIPAGATASPVSGRTVAPGTPLDATASASSTNLFVGESFQIQISVPATAWPMYAALNLSFGDGTHYQGVQEGSPYYPVLLAAIHAYGSSGTFQLTWVVTSPNGSANGTLPIHVQGGAAAFGSSPADLSGALLGAVTVLAIGRLFWPIWVGEDWQAASRDAPGSGPSNQVGRRAPNGYQLRFRVGAAGGGATILIGLLLLGTCTLISSEIVGAAVHGTAPPSGELGFLYGLMALGLLGVILGAAAVMLDLLFAPGELPNPGIPRPSRSRTCTIFAVAVGALLLLSWSVASATPVAQELSFQVDVSASAGCFAGVESPVAYPAFSFVPGAQVVLHWATLDGLPAFVYVAPGDSAEKVRMVSPAGSSEAEYSSGDLVLTTTSAPFQVEGCAAVWSGTGPVSYASTTFDFTGTEYYNGTLAL